MKKLFPLFALFVLLACNNNEEHSSTVDSTHGSHTANDSTVKSAYALMQQNMQQMMMAPSSGVADVDFAALMKIHHQGAIDMAHLEIAEGKSDTLLAMANQIINDQQKEIAVFDSLLAGWKEKGTDSSFYKKAMMDMHQMSLKEEKSHVDREFLQMMIPHHEGAIVMARTYLSNGAKHAALKTIAKNIIAVQQAEIGRFKKLLEEMK